MAFSTHFLKAAPALAAVVLMSGTACAEDAANIFDRERLGGDLGGLRSKLKDAGFEIGVDYAGETMGVVSGGVQRGFVYEGIVSAALDVDFERFLGWHGGTGHVEMLEAHGRGPSTDLLGGNLMDVSNIEARKNVRLYTLWLEQSLFGNRIALQVGQLAADDEFMISDTAGNLLNGTFGWPILASANMRGGGAAYPVPTPGVRLRVGATPDLTLRAAVFNGNPGGEGCDDDPQICNPHGTEFHLGGGALWIGEVHFAPESAAFGLPGSYKLGAWRETGAFADQFSGAPDHRGNFGFYAIADQTLWRRPGTDGQGLNAFLRVGAAPADRNFIAWYVDGGFGFTGPIAGRPNDVVTLGVAYGRISVDAADADRAAGPPTPVRNHEAVIELGYTLALAPWWLVQPDVQYVIHPGGNVAHPNGTDVVDDALVLGLRTTIAF